ncbi:probable pectinesterase/pectinesterase inhibitor 6 [Diospyros lotus]|uniref:probable pectinesterase/pectinesterase inhibitor 6 n=1 Tax=Diospyros lotus TaxID=55363 RepID=UPI00224F6EEC|nr:probable pectinesterase/pectinesterase inhibitor 6 [Diospyros lotus]
MTFENTAGPEKQQAVAVRCSGDFSVFFRCSFQGYQDTLFVISQRQFYRLCDIYGTIDFIFGNAVAVLQNCNICVRKPMSHQQNVITAQGRTDPNQNTGIVIHNSIVKAMVGRHKTYLGRPWQKYSRTVFMKCDLDSLIDPKGWLPWEGSFGLSTLYYGEYMNTGTGGRVGWSGYHVISSSTEAQKFTVANFLAGGAWISAAGVPFTSGL